MSDNQKFGLVLFQQFIFNHGSQKEFEKIGVFT